MNAHSAAGAGTTVTALDRGQIDALGVGSHENAFGVLGPHQVSADRWEIRIFLPQATGVSVLPRSGEPIVAERVSPAGLFVASVAGAHRPTYRLHVRTPWGEHDVADAYNFGPVIASDRTHALERADAPWDILGAQLCTHEGVAGTSFAVWAPNARRVSVIGDWNGWDGRVHPMRRRYDGGLYDLFIPHVEAGARYKFEMIGPDGRLLPSKADPFAFATEKPPATASVVCALPKPPDDADWQRRRAMMAARNAPISIYECHLGSWARVPGEGNRYLTYAELADKLIPYVKDLGFTHIELLPISEFPFDGSWGYQPVSLFAPTSRFGTPQDFAAFVKAVHAAGLGLIAP